MPISRVDESRRRFLTQMAGVAATVVLPSGFVGCSSAGRKRLQPNIVFIMADDLGYADVGFTGGTQATPNLDRIASEGMVLRQAYSSAPVCSPTRVALLTGRYPAREDVGLLEPLTTQATGLSPQPPTLAMLLRGAGYETALVGKWHLGVLPAFHPLRHGFDEFYGFLGGAADYVSHDDPVHRRSLFRDGENEAREDGYLTDLFTQRATRIIARERVRPLFLSLQYNAPHWPWQAPGDPAYPAGSDSRAGGSPETFARMVASLDEGVGRVLATIDARGMARDTLLIFTSDNGGERFSHMGPFSHGKMTLSEGGIRVAAAARWPAVIRAGTTTDQVAATMDWTATFVALAGAVPAQELDGIDLTPALRGLPPVARELCWRVSQRRQQRAVRQGDLKLLIDEQGERLHDVVRDPGERVDLRRERSSDFDALRARLAAWEAEMLAPLPFDPALR